MDWIKNKYEQALLLAAVIILLVSSAFVFLKVKSSGDIFASYFSPYSENNQIKPISTEPITEAGNAIANPAKWIRPDRKTVFVSAQYILRKEGDRLDLFDENLTEIHPGIPNQWFTDNEIELLAPDAPEQDPDGDRFTNREEFLAKTNPNDIQSTPPLTDKLRLKEYQQIPFRLVFKARTNETVQINTIDLRQPSQFLKVGDKIARTKFEIIKLEIKEGVDSYGTPKDISELTIRNTETTAEIILVLGVIANSPDTFALFRNLIDGSEYRVKKDGEFQLKQDEKTTYKLIDINASQAVINAGKSGINITIPKL